MSNLSYVENTFMFEHDGSHYDFNELSEEGLIMKLYDEACVAQQARNEGCSMINADCTFRISCELHPMEFVPLVQLDDDMFNALARALGV